MRLGPSAIWLRLYIHVYVSTSYVIGTIVYQLLEKPIVTQGLKARDDIQEFIGNARLPLLAEPGL